MTVTEKRRIWDGVVMTSGTGSYLRVFIVRARLQPLLVYVRVGLGTIGVIGPQLREWSQQGVLT